MSSCRTSILVCVQTVSDEVQESWMINGLHQLGATLRSREITSVHLHQENSETVDVHLGCLEGGVTGLGGSVHWTSRILGLQLALEVGGAVVRDLGQPASVGGTLALLRSLWMMGSGVLWWR